ncbi:MAG TPA: RES domain-containing protein [Acidimicrobiales bacterium]|nr:RES domain-containing protein [Acidimicrobiales bacterium]
MAADEQHLPDEALVDRVNELGTSAWTGTAYRHTAVGRDPLSGEGARLNGARWNPPGRPTIYLAQPEKSCMAELARSAERGGFPLRALLRRGRELHTMDVQKLLLDLRSAEALDHVGLTLDDVEDDDWGACQAIGEAAHFLAMAGVAAPSATGVGFVIAAFEDRVKAGQLTHRRTISLDKVTYERLAL